MTHAPPARAVWPLRRAMVGVTLVGLGVAGYLTWVHYAGEHPLCVGGQACERVQASHWARLGGLPVAALGLADYAAILGSLALRGEAARLLTATLAISGAGYGVFLTYVEIFRIHAVCQWCVASAVVMITLAFLSIGLVLGVGDRRKPAGAGLRRADGCA